MKQVEWVLFDLGGVVIEVNQSCIFEELAKQTGLGVVEVREKVLRAVPLQNEFIVQEYLPGRLTNDVNRALAANLTQEQVLNAFNAELGKPINTTVDLLPTLRSRIKVGCLSNTNSIHWDRMLSNYSFMGHFDRRFASQIIGYAKPGAQIYRKVVELLDVMPRQILFFDDKQENVDAAERLGWYARRYFNQQSLLADLKEFGVV